MNQSFESIRRDWAEEAAAADTGERPLCSRSPVWLSFRVRPQSQEHGEVLDVRHFALVVMLVAVMASSDRAASLSKPQELEKELRQVVLKNFEAGERQNLAESMKALHTQSPAYVPTYQATQQILSLFRLHAELEYFRYVGEDEGFVFAHVKQKTTKIAGPAFRDNVTDSLYVFRREDQEWKIWTQVVLGTDYLDSQK